MATPRRIYRIYLRLAECAEDIASIQVATGQKVSSTVKSLIARDRAKLLARWGEEMGELCGVLDGSHSDPYAMEATQTFYWASLFAATAATRWDDLRFDEQMRAAATAGITTVPELKAAVDRLVAIGPEAAKPEKLFLLWCCSHLIYRRVADPDTLISLESLMEIDLQDMKKRDYLRGILTEIAD